MSNFLPDTTTRPGQGQSQGAAQETAAAITEKDRADAKRLLRPELFDEKLLSYLVDYLAVNQPPIPVSLLTGYARQVWNHAEVDTEETTTSGTYVDLATAGPSITGLSDGEYIISYGARLKHTTAARSANMSLSINGAAASDDDVVAAESSGTAYYVSVSRSRVKTLDSGGANTITCKYNNGGAGTATFFRRWLIAQRIGNV